MSERRCENCRHWKRHTAFTVAGDCLTEHRHSRAAMPDGSVAMLDSFGPAETRQNDICGAWNARREIPDHG